MNIISRLKLYEQKVRKKELIPFGNSFQEVLIQPQ